MSSAQWRLGDAAVEIEPMRSYGGANPFGKDDLFTVGEAVRMFAEDVGLAYTAIRSCRWVSSRWPKERRRADVSHTIHKILAGIPDEQERFEAVTNPPPAQPARRPAVAAGDAFTVGSISVTVHGHRHALIHADVPCPDNVGHLLDDGTLYHPGDAYFAPDAPVRTLLLPTSGPWTNLGEAADYVRTVKPERIVQIHELMLSDLGRRSAAHLLGEKGLTGIPISLLESGTTVQL
ncbi:DUF6192 family protein [Streptomyces sp. NPDC047000]|uniref:MBL fold metallo-hydrolase n=1 Tax=Streptomyces sp. NPDC047000 TaxID=3155474 RepID=UPI003401DA95